MGYKEKIIVINRICDQILKESETKWLGRVGAYKIASTFGVTIIGMGNTRLVIEIDEYTVAKIPTKYYGLDCNRQEIKKWKETLLNSTSQFFTKLIDHDPNGKWLLMERVIPINGDNDNQPFIVEEPPDEIKGLIQDDCTFNYGKRSDGSWVILDYAV